MTKMEFDDFYDFFSIGVNQRRKVWNIMKQSLPQLPIGVHKMRQFACERDFWYRSLSKKVSYFTTPAMPNGLSGIFPISRTITTIYGRSWAAQVVPNPVLIGPKEGLSTENDNSFLMKRAHIKHLANKDLKADEGRKITVS